MKRGPGSISKISLPGLVISSSLSCGCHTKCILFSRHVIHDFSPCSTPNPRGLQKLYRSFSYLKVMLSCTAINKLPGNSPEHATLTNELDSNHTPYRLKTLLKLGITLYAWYDLLSSIIEPTCNSKFTDQKTKLFIQHHSQSPIGN